MEELLNNFKITFLPNQKEGTIHPPSIKNC
jgi:hypothetical protein